MDARFELTGPLTELTSYPRWTQDMVADAETTKQTVVSHEIWDVMRELRHDQESTVDFMVGIWPVIERFPCYMANSLLKTRYGRSHGENMARRWLVRNIRVEQNHAEYWLDWAEGAGVTREAVQNGVANNFTDVLPNWCEEISSTGSLAASNAATNYAVEGATGEWSQLLYDSTDYKNSFAPEVRKSSLRWLHVHADYDDTHPWEALEIVCNLVGPNPSVNEVAHLGSCIKRSYASMRTTLDRCTPSRRVHADSEHQNWADNHMPAQAAA